MKANKERTDDLSYKPIDSLDTEQLSTPPEPKQSKADEILQRIYSKSVPEPVFDQAKADRLQKMGRINQMGRGIGVLGDMLATGLGAPIKRRQSDTVSNALYQSYSDNLDKYKSDQDIHSLRQYSKYLDDAKLGLSEERRAEQLDFQNRKQADWMKAKEADSKLNWAKWQADYDMKNKNLDLNTKKAKSDENYKNARLKIEQQKADKPTAAEAAANKPFDPVQVKDKFGNSVKLDQGQWDNLYQSAMRDSEFTNGNLKAEISKYKDLPDGGVKQIARAYHDFKQQKEYQAGEKAALEQHRKEKGPVQPTFNPDKAKKFKGVPQGGF